MVTLVCVALLGKRLWERASHVAGDGGLLADNQFLAHGAGTLAPPISGTCVVGVTMPDRWPSRPQAFGP